jgi:uncharacterized protein (DUF362 family)
LENRQVQIFQLSKKEATIVQMIKEKIKNMSLVSFVKIPKDAEYPMKQAVSESLQLINYSFDKSVRKVVIKPNLCYYWDCSTGQTTEPRFVSELMGTNLC